MPASVSRCERFVGVRRAGIPRAVCRGGRPRSSGRSRPADGIAPSCRRRRSTRSQWSDASNSCTTAAVDFLLRAGQREVGQPRAGEILIFFCARLAMTRSRRRHDVDAQRAETVDHHSRTAAGCGHRRDAVARAGRWLVEQQAAARTGSRSYRRARMPWARKNASATSSAPAIAPVCDAGKLLADRRSGRACRRPPACRRRYARRAACASRVGVADGFHEEQDRARSADRRPAVGDLANAEVAFVADRYQLREAGAATQAARQQRRPSCCPICETIASAPGCDLRVLQHRVDRQRQ